MASKYPESSSLPRGDRIHPLDMVSCNNELLCTIPTTRLAVTVLLTTIFYDKSTNAVLYHCIVDNERRTFLRGKCQWLGLDNAAKEYECEELRGKCVIQCFIATSNVFHSRGHAYVLTDEGELYSLGYADSRLGRSTSDVKSTAFGVVPIRETILAIASGVAHCLAMSASKVFAFGHNSYGQTGVPAGSNRIPTPTGIYTGSDGEAPYQVAAGHIHSVILTHGGEVYTFGKGEYGETGHGGTKNIFKPTLIKTRQAKIEQIGCTADATFFLADGKIFGCGYNNNSSLGLGHSKTVYIPTLIDTGGDAITSFRCSDTLVVAYTVLRDALVWGKCCDKVIKVPNVQPLDFPRDFFSRGPRKDTGGAVYPDHRHRKLEAMRVLSSKMSEFKTEITSKMRDFNTEIATQMLDFKVEIPASEEDSGEKIGSQGEHDDVEERLIKQNRKIEEILTLQIKLVNVEKDRAKLAKDLSQQQWTHENLQAKHNALLSHHQCLSKDPALMQDTSDDEKKRQAEEMEEISDLKKELQLSRQEVEEHQKAHGALMAKYKALLSEHEVLKEEQALPQDMADNEKNIRDELKINPTTEDREDEQSHEALLTEHTSPIADHENSQTDLQRTLRDVINLPALHVVVNMVGQKWYRLGLKLGIPDFQLDHIDHACLNLPDKALVTLNKWYELAPWQATRDYLADSLEYVERKDIADAIRDKK